MWYRCSVQESPIQQFDSLLKTSLFSRLHGRILILALAFSAAISGLVAPFFQKIFVDRLLGAGHSSLAVGVFAWTMEVSPIFLIVLAFIGAVLGQGFSLLASYVGVRESTILQRQFSEGLYTKMLGLRSESMAGSTVGEVVSIYATDVPGATALVDMSIPMASGIFFPLVFGPLAINWICGIPLWATLLVMALIVCFNVILSSRQARFFYRFKQLAAERTGLVNEWIQNIRLLRILGWVEDFESKIFRKRVEETDNRISMVTNGQMMSSFGSSISFVINLTGVASLVFLREKPVSAGELFALLWIFGVFLQRPFRQVPWFLTTTLDSLSSMRRLERFLQRRSDAGAVETHDQTDESSFQKAASLPLEIRGLNLTIGDQPLLRDIDLSVQAGEFVAIVGEVGAGKSLLVLSLMGETGATFDRFEIGSSNALKMELNTRRRHFAFVPQEGFVMSATLRENVAFRYEVTSAVDAEVSDSLRLSQFKFETDHVRDGLDAEIGERGVNLSGGQRQRVSLARATFFNRPIVLLDDCLSALDVDTENQLITSLINGAWKNKTRVLVTHRLSVLSEVDRILFMKDGRIVESGRFDELMKRSPEMREFVASVRRQEEKQDVDTIPELARLTSAVASSDAAETRSGDAKAKAESVP